MLEGRDSGSTLGPVAMTSKVFMISLMLPCYSEFPMLESSAPAFSSTTPLSVGFGHIKGFASFSFISFFFLSKCALSFFSRLFSVVISFFIRSVQPRLGLASISSK
eukprot:TRINITY_DN3807_c0_g1_i5.p1 TRINITY_DN3807_c0_g1~~TRINITY_DN3807_c0_g1_i5.p1  ORF type:complete len:106 (-),score=2.01 TRINITY_DN3807_c0_g1_i5:310-627(-)